LVLGKYRKDTINDTLRGSLGGIMTTITMKINTDKLFSYSLLSDNSFYDELWKVRKLLANNTETEKLFDSTNNISVFLYDTNNNKIGYITREE
jgi:hypothetical protein